MKFENYLEIKFFHNLDILRCLAIILVFVHHITLQTTHFLHPYLNNLHLNGRFGVRLFFVISGYLIMSLIIREELYFKQFNIKNFLIRRGLKIYPLYFLMLFVYCIMIFQLNMYSPENQLLFKDKLISYIFYYSNFLATATIGPFFVAWSLAAEEQFYFAIAFLKKVFSEKIIFTIILIMLFIKMLLLNLFPTSSTPLVRGILNYQEPILIGVMIAIICHKKPIFNLLNNFLSWKQNSIFIILILFLVGTLFLIPIHHTSSLLSNLLYLITGLIVFKSSISQPFIQSGYSYVSLVGKVSYGMYLFHMIILNSIAKFVPANYFLTTLSIGFITTFTLAYISFKTFETYFLRFKHKFRTTRESIIAP